jgi:hypothetical protein
MCVLDACFFCKMRIAHKRLPLIVQVGDGINSAMRDWGDFLLGRSGKPKGRWKSDFSLSHLGYTTDNGAYYYYNTEPGKNYQDTILDLHTYLTQENIPVRWILCVVLNLKLVSAMFTFPPFHCALGFACPEIGIMWLVVCSHEFVTCLSHARNT